LVYDKPEPIKNLITWVYEGGSFVPSAKIVGEEKFSIINDYIGRPVQVYNEKGDVVWETDYDIYGGVRELKGDKSFIPFRQLGQYEDLEISLFYNRFRYYSSETGLYISRDPVGLDSREYNFYRHVSDINSIVDIFGLDWNYFLNNSDGESYYHGRADDKATMEDVAKRHAKTDGTDGVRFGEGDKMTRVTEVGSDKDLVRGIEQRGVEENDLLGYNSDKARGNKINGISEAKQKKPNGIRRLEKADNLLNGKKVSALPSLQELEFDSKFRGCK
jgi:RHS repeat-associated protein